MENIYLMGKKNIFGINVFFSFRSAVLHSVSLQLLRECIHFLSISQGSEIKVNGGLLVFLSAIFPIFIIQAFSVILFHMLLIKSHYHLKIFFKFSVYRGCKANSLDCLYLCNRWL